MFKEPYNKWFINLVLLGLYGKVFAFGLSTQTSLLRRSVCTKTSGKYFPVQTSLSVNNSLISIRVEIGKTRNCVFIVHVVKAHFHSRKISTDRKFSCLCRVKWAFLRLGLYHLKNEQHNDAVHWYVYCLCIF